MKHSAPLRYQQLPRPGPILQPTTLCPSIPLQSTFATVALRLLGACALREAWYNLLGEAVHRILIIGHSWEAHDEIVKPGIYLHLQCLSDLLSCPNHPATRILLIAGLTAIIYLP